MNNISRNIVTQAIDTNAIIVLGDTKHLRMQKQNIRGRKFNRTLSGFQYYKLLHCYLFIVTASI
jgi:IS605 OrfB family transposase